MSNVTLRYSAGLSKSDPIQHPVLIIGQTKNLNQVNYESIKCKLEPRVNQETYNTAVSNLHPSPTDSCPLWLTNATVAALPTKCSRHNTPSRAHSLTKIVKSCASGGDEYIVIVCERDDVFASGCAVARAFSLFTRKSGCTTTKRTVTVEFVLVGAGSEHPVTDQDVKCLQDAAQGIRLAAKIVDAPCEDMHVGKFLMEINKVGKELGISPFVIRGDELEQKGFGGIYNVGKAAVNSPALAVLSHKPDGATKTVAWVGKGIVFDTGGLSIKGKTAMPGMKRDCGGAAAILGAFLAAVKQGFKDNLHAVFCLAENAVGPTAVRPDDIITLYSGRTVEINNTDAEGRLVLGDGVAYASNNLKADIILDMATLTGAQGIATGKYHGAVVTNNENWELAAVKAGRYSSDLVHPLMYTPELHFSEFASAVADMKNSVADRSNAQVTCAALFIGAHLGFEYPGVWLHVDMAYPVHSGERATGYGVALLLTLFGESSTTPLLQNSALSAQDGMVDGECATKKIRLS